MSRTLNVSFEVADVTAERVSSFELVKELGRPFSLLIHVNFNEDVAPLNSVGTSAVLTFGYEGEPVHEVVGIVESVTQPGTPVMGGASAGGGSAHVATFRVTSIVALTEG